MKVVINKCFGGFSLSPEGLTAYLARKGEKAFFYEADRSSGGVTDRDYDRVDGAPYDGIFGPTCVVTDFGPRATHDQIWKSGAYRTSSDIPRDDNDLVAVVEEIGRKADGACAQLAIVEIPDGILWEIDEYDGIESIEEAHRSWA